MSESVVADPVYSIATVLKPPPRFEALYQGQPAFFPIAMPGQLDPDAGKQGFDPRLIDGLPVALGSKLLLWFPAITNTESATPDIVGQDYTYTLLWRLRNVVDFRNRRIPYHLSRQSPGVADTTVPNGGARFLIPGATETVVFNQPEPSGSLAIAVPNLRREAINVVGAGLSVFFPIVPGAPPTPGIPTPAGSGLGAIQQGVLNPASFAPGPGATALSASYLPYLTVCKGDELIIFAQRTDQDALPTWDFQSEDRGFSNVYGTNVAGPNHAYFDEVGVYVMTGVAPT